MAQKKISYSIDDGEAFFANEVTVNFNQQQFVLDFKQITPRFDPRSNEAPVLRIKHSPIILSPAHLKQFSEILQKAIQDYEKKIEEIKLPDKTEKLKKKDSEINSDIMSYYG